MHQNLNQNYRAPDSDTSIIAAASRYRHAAHTETIEPTVSNPCSGQGVSP
eukprot:m.231256 g.231256  ORF g.231256 m.231256 type:complete len:50 (-) comp19266_c1_seq6:478-627(-)